MPSEDIARALLAQSAQPMTDQIMANREKSWTEKLGEIFGYQNGQWQAPGLADAISYGAMGLPMGRMGFTARMDQGKALAEIARSKGFATGKSAPGWNYKPPPSPEKGSYERLRQLTNERMSNSSELAQEDYRRAAYPERYQGFE